MLRIEVICILIEFKNFMEEQPKKQKKHVQWDQQKLHQTQKYRGTFQKIDEPKTPYRKNSDSDQEQMQPEVKSQEEIALDESLYKARMNSRSNHNKKVNIAELNAKLKEELDQFHNGEKSQMEDQEEQQRRKKKQEFKKKRTQHYNQYQLIQKVRQQRWEQEDD